MEALVQWKEFQETRHVSFVFSPVQKEYLPNQKKARKELKQKVCTCLILFYGY